MEAIELIGSFFLGIVFNILCIIFTPVLFFMEMVFRFTEKMIRDGENFREAFLRRSRERKQ